jgi:hypothetical protein
MRALRRAGGMVLLTGHPYRGYLSNQVGRSWLQLHTPSEHARCHLLRAAKQGLVPRKCGEVATWCRSGKNGGQWSLRLYPSPPGLFWKSWTYRRVVVPLLTEGRRRDRSALRKCGKSEDRNPGNRKPVHRPGQPMRYGSRGAVEPRDSGSNEIPGQIGAGRRWEPSRALESGPTTSPETPAFLE